MRRDLNELADDELDVPLGVLEIIEGALEIGDGARTGEEDEEKERKEEQGSEGIEAGEERKKRKERTEDG